jgi:formate dehydrogenase subunit gamma
MASPATVQETVGRVLAERRHMAGALLPVLHGIQDALGYVPPEAVPQIADGLNLSRAEIHGVISFYHHFRDTPPGRHTVYLCRAESCQAMQGRALEAHAKHALEIDFHETTADGGVTLEPIYCLGNCALSPAVMIDGDVHGRVYAATLRCTHWRFPTARPGLRQQGHRQGTGCATARSDRC